MKFRNLKYSCAVLALIGSTQVGQAQEVEAKAMRDAVRVAVSKAHSPNALLKLQRIIARFTGTPSESKLREVRKAIRSTAKAYSEAAEELQNLYAAMSGATGSSGGGESIDGAVQAKSLVGGVIPNNVLTNVVIPGGGGNGSGNSGNGNGRSRPRPPKLENPSGPRLPPAQTGRGNAPIVG